MSKYPQTQNITHTSVNPDIQSIYSVPSNIELPNINLQDLELTALYKYKNLDGTLNMLIAYYQNQNDGQEFRLFSYFYDPTEGVRFEVHYEKNRGFYGEDAKSFEVNLVKKDGREEWVSQAIKAVNAEIKNEIQELSESGRSIRQIAEELNLTKSTVGRILKEISKE